MGITVDSSKRLRIRQAKPGEVYKIETVPSGFLLTRLVKPTRPKPVVAKTPIPAKDFQSVDLDEPAFESMDKDESSY